MSKGRGRIVKAALLALAAGGLVAVGNPARPIDRDVSIAMSSALRLTATVAAAARNTLPIASLSRA